MLHRLIVIMCLAMAAAHQTFAQTSGSVRIQQINLNCCLTRSMTTVSLFADGTTDLIVDVSHSIIGTTDSGEVFVLANMSRANPGLPEKSQTSQNKTGQWWADSYVVLSIERKDHETRASFQWMRHLGEFRYFDVNFFQKFRDGKFVATYAIKSVLIQRPHPSFAEDLTEASLVFNLYVLKNVEGHGTGYPRDLFFTFVTSANAPEVTGDPVELSKDFDHLIRDN